jgi:para-aminobenzoate synthetase component 1
MGAYGAVVRWRRGPDGGVGEIIGADPAARARLAELIAAGPSTPAPPPRLGALVADDDGAAHCARVDRILAYIAAGDVYQVNLARRLVAPILADGDALALHAALIAASPAPYAGLLEGDGAIVVSGSPERFLARAAGSALIDTRPIKGTRPRTGEATRDRALAAELAVDPKESAEHLMIVDLERNDLGRVAVTGSVVVERLGYIVELPTLYHRVSTITAELRPDVGLAALLRATFPGGSITGAPKVRAMQIIDELEPARRGPYCGALGFLGAGGSLELAIAIRVAVLAGPELRLHVGGGIVADSVPAHELAETETKAEGWRRALRALAD